MMGGGLTTPEFARLFQRPLDGRTNHVHDGELASRVNLAKVDDDAETSKKQKCAVAKGGQVRTRRAAKDAVEADADDEDDGEWEGGSDDDARSCGYTPSPVRAKAGAGSSASPTRPQDITSANVLLAIVGSASKTGTTARKKKKGVVRGAGGFSDSEVSSDGMPTSPAPRRSIPRRRRLSPPPASDADAPTGGSASATAVAPTGTLQPAAANVSGADGASTLPSASRQREDKVSAVEMTVSDMTLTAPHFVSTNFTSRPEITPFIDGVCQIVSPTGGPSPFTELNEFGEGCVAAESLHVRVHLFLFRLFVYLFFVLLRSTVLFCLF